jgi:hypothetical protein
MKIDMTGWANFTVSDLFEIINGKGITAEEIENNPGDFEAVQSGEGNNGVMGYISKAYCRYKGYSYCEEACLTVARSGTSGYVSFHENGCVVGDSAKILLLKKHEAKSTQTYLFLQTLLTANRFKYTYGRKVTKALYGNTVIKLPITTNGDPDWQWMENYIKSLHNEPLTTQNDMRIASFDTTDWKEFEVQELFNVVYGVNFELVNCIETNKNDPEAVAFVSRTESNNGVSAFVKSVPGIEPQPADTITVAGGGSVLATFLQTQPFYSGRDLYLLYPKESIPHKAKLFIVTVIKANKYRYNYGRQANVTLPHLRLRLPAISNGKPDWQWMENYIESLPYGDRL